MVEIAPLSTFTQKRSIKYVPKKFARICKDINIYFYWIDRYMFVIIDWTVEKLLLE
jgi:hypothetical protein